MDFPDVNILIYAVDAGAKDHESYKSWLQNLTDCGDPFAIAEVVLNSFIRITTNPKILDSPLTIDEATDFVDRLARHARCEFIQPGWRHWEAFVELCRNSGVTGNLVPDAYLAALAIELDYDFVTADRDFHKFPGLRWRHPLDE